MDKANNMSTSHQHSNFFRHKTVTDVYNLLTNHPDSEEGNQLLSWVNFDGPVTTEEWHQFVQKVTFHTSSVTHMHNAKLFLTICDLLLHLTLSLMVVQFCAE